MITEVMYKRLEHSPIQTLTEFDRCQSSCIGVRVQLTQIVGVGPKIENVHSDIFLKLVAKYLYSLFFAQTLKQYTLWIQVNTWHSA